MTIQQQFPRLDAPIVTANGTPSTVFGQFMLNLWAKLGGSSAVAAKAAFISLDGATVGLPADLYRSSDGQLIGALALANVPGDPAQVLSPAVSPFTFAAPHDGTLIVFSGELEVSRNSGVTWYKVSLTGGALPMLVKDQARVTWYGEPPQVTFLPISGSG